jgi:UDP-N-acetylglucosamine--N-acetylmuramyl-(pentapeptide) pyrophosphoryl-undecaprenol N-acetylglucosamine transferase
MDKAHIVFMAGGTGGHIFPALALAHKFIATGYSVSWLGALNSMEARIIPEQGIAIDYLPIQNVRGKGLKRWLLLPWRLMNSIIIARRVLKKHHTALVIGMGGFVSGPGALAAKTLNIPLLIHEQNAIAGFTNRYLAKIANVVLCGFPEPFSQRVAAVYLGNPVRADFINLHAQPIRPPSIPLRVLVVGGSQGARIFNDILPKTLAALPLGTIELWQQTGATLYEAAVVNFKNLPAKIMPFIDDMAGAYAWADLVICRAGALTIAELCAAKKPAILVPLPTAVDDHQRLNAEFLSQQGAGLLILQKNFSAEKLTQTLLELIQMPEPLQAMAFKAGTLARLDATDKIFSEAVRLLTPPVNTKCDSRCKVIEKN